MSRRPVGCTVVALAAVASLCTACGSSTSARRPTTQSTPGWTRTGQGPVGLTVDHAGGTWVADADSGSLARLSAGGGAVTRRVRVGDAPLRLAGAGDGLWATVFRDGALVRVDAATGRVTRRVHVGESPEGIVAASGAVWVVLEDPAQLVRVDPTSGRVLQRVRSVGEAPRLVTTGAGALWVSDFESGTVVRVDPRTGRTRSTPQLCQGPQGMTFLNRRLWVACTTGEELVAVDPATLRPGGRLHLPGDPDAVAAAGDRLVVALQDGPALALVDPGASGGSAHVVRRQGARARGQALRPRERRRTQRHRSRLVVPRRRCLPRAAGLSVRAQPTASTPARFFLPRRRTSQQPPSRSASPGTRSGSVTRSLLR